jgi:hypothetical protein
MYHGSSASNRYSSISTRKKFSQITAMMHLNQNPYAVSGTTLLRHRSKKKQSSILPLSLPLLVQKEQQFYPVCLAL